MNKYFSSKITLKRLPTLDLNNENKLHELRVSIPLGKSRKLTKNIIPISKAAQMLQVNPDTLRNWEKQGRLIPDRTPGGSRRYNLFELQEIQKQLNIKKETPIKTPFAGLSVSKAAKLLQVSPDTIRNWDNKGLIFSQRASGGARRFSKNVVMKLREEMNIGDIASTDQVQKPVSQPQSDRLGHSMAIIILLVVLSAGALLGLFTGFQMMRMIDDVSKNTHNIDQRVEDIQKQLVTVSGVADAARELSANIKFSSSEFGPHQVNSEANILGESTNLVDQIILKGNTAIEGLLTAPNVIYGLIAGSNVAISGGQTPTITLKLPALVNSLNGTSGALKLIGGTDIQVDGLIINNSSTLSSVRGRGGCDNCLADADIQDNLTVSSEGNIDTGAIKKGQLSIEHGGTGLTSFVTGDMLVADSNTSLAALNAGNIGSTLIIGVSNKPVWSDSLIIDSTTGNVGIGTTAPDYTIDVVGDAGLSTGTLWTNTSDVRVKQNIQIIPNALGLIAQLKPSEYMYTPEYLANHPEIKNIEHFGFIAQDFQQVFPESVTTGSDGYLQVNASNVIPYMAKAIQELAFKVNSYNLTLDSAGNVVLPEVKMDQLVLASDTPVNEATATNYFDLAATISDMDSRLRGNDSVIDSLRVEVASLLARLQAPERPPATTGTVGQGSDGGQAQLISVRSTSEESPMSPPSEVSTDSARLQALSVQADSGQAQIASNSSQLIANGLSPENAASSSATSPQPQAISDLNLTPPSILLATSSATLANLSDSSEATVSGKLTAYEATISNTFKALGNSFLGNTTVAGDFSVDGTLSLTGNSLNSIACANTPGEPGLTPGVSNCGILYLQNSPLAQGIDFFNGMVTIDKTGTLIAQAVTLSELRVKGNKISGNAKIASGTKSIEIDNSVVSVRSRILVTPTTETDTVLAVTSKEENKKFTVTASKNVSQDITFDWWLISEVD